MERTLEQIIQNFDTLELPIGVYFVEPDGRFLACNRILREMLGLPLSGPVEARSTDFYVRPDERPGLLARAEAAEREERAPEKQIIALRVRGRQLYVEDHCRPLRAPRTDEIIGYVGCLIDATDEIRARRAERAWRSKLHDLTLDIGKVLHTHSNTLFMVKQTLESVADVLDPELAAVLDEVSDDELEARLMEQAARCAAALDRFREAGVPERRDQALPSTRWNEMARISGLLADPASRVPVAAHRAATLRTAAVTLRDALRELDSGWLPREPQRALQHEVDQLVRLAMLMDIRETRTAVLTVDHTLHALRDFITADVREPEIESRLAVASLLEQAIQQLAEFSQSAGVEIRLLEQSEAEVVGNERELVRALANLIHNAIKYTWRRDRAQASWVSIRTTEADSRVSIAIENWGVPITREEIEQALIYRIGYRGKHSRDRGRSGTGIGLADARRVAEDHEGLLEIDSRPAAAGRQTPDHPAYYNQPFLTTVTLHLPIAGPWEG